MKTKKLISIVIPCFNEEDVLHETVKRLNAISSGLLKYEIELIFIDDGSHDKNMRGLNGCSESWF